MTYCSSRRLQFAALAGAAMLAPPAYASSFQLLFQFNGASGAQPIYRPVLGPHGVLYGTTYAGGTDDSGTVYKFSNGVLTTLLSGGQPEPSLVADSDGNLYLAQLSGGANGRGAISRWDPVNGLSVLYSFTGGKDGSEPNTLTRAADGTLYGTAALGGSKTGVCAPTGCGTVFSLSSAGKLKVLHTFKGKDGATPTTALLRAGHTLFGATLYDAQGVQGGDAGSAFSISDTGAGFATYAIPGSPGTAYNFEGAQVQDSAGNIWGTAVDSEPGYGVIYKIDTSGTLTIAYTFQAAADGAYPESDLEIDGNDVIYGTTQGNGTYSEGSGPGGYGTVFSYDTKAGTLTTLHSFSQTDGANPIAGVTLDPAGNLYGVTGFGGAYDKGVLFRITP